VQLDTIRPPDILSPTYQRTGWAIPVKITKVHVPISNHFGLLVIGARLLLEYVRHFTGETNFSCDGGFAIFTTKVHLGVRRSDLRSDLEHQTAAPDRAIVSKAAGVCRAIEVPVGVDCQTVVGVEAIADAGEVVQ
jgi:hypothetical protein